MFKIDKNIIITNSKYPFESMVIGDSFFIKTNKKSKDMSLHSCAKRCKVKITMRKVDNGIRIWRVA